MSTSELRNGMNHPETDNRYPWTISIRGNRVEPFQALKGVTGPAFAYDSDVENSMIIAIRQANSWIDSQLLRESGGETQQRIEDVAKGTPVVDASQGDVLALTDQRQPVPVTAPIHDLL